MQERPTENKFVYYTIGTLLMNSFEKKLWNEGFDLVAGIDEAGRGALAGPVVAAAVIFPPGSENFGLRDSKKLTAARRDALFIEIEQKAVSIGIGVVGNEDIDRINILRATLKAMEAAISFLSLKPDYLIIDGNQSVKSEIPHETIVKGDDRSFSIAAASIIAKVTRDRLMTSLHDKYPHYNFPGHKGYGTEEHRDAIKRYGMSSVHRKSFVLKAREGEQFSIFQ